MVDLNKAEQSTIGEDGPTEASKSKVDEIVNDVVSSVISQSKDSPDNKSDSKQEVQDSEEVKEVEESSDLKETESSDSEVLEEQKDEEKVEDEYLVPRSKVQPRFDEMTAKIRRLEAENESLKRKKPQTQDEKLERLTIDELKALKRQNKIAQRKSSDDSNLEELIDLEDKVDDFIQDYPNRFQRKQVENLSSVLKDFSEIDPDVMNQKGELWSTAAKIFQRSSSLKNSEMGQVEAMMLAAEHLQLKRSVNTNNEKSNTLSRQVNNLKKRTSLDGKMRVQGNKGVNLEKLREKARTGDLVDKENFFKEAIVPDDFLQV